MLLTLLLSACAAHAPPAEISAVTTLSGDAMSGGAVWREHCAGCHGADGTRMTKKPLKELVPALPDAKLVDTVLSGPSIMPSFRGRLTPQQIADVTAWLRAGLPG